MPIQNRAASGVPAPKVPDGGAPSKIVKVEAFELDIPFDDGSSGTQAPTGRWSRFESVLVRITTADGHQGWGECFAYGCRSAVAESFRRMVAPLLLGQNAEEVEALIQRVQHKLHLFGRYGITMFAISGADIALWDRRARAEAQPLAALLGPRLRNEVAAYASLNHYGSPAVVHDMARRAVDDGYASVKLHETAPEMIRAGREGAGYSTHLTVDANCAWSLTQAQALLPELEALELGWLEEPLFPPEDFEAMASLAGATVIPLSAGENACTRYEFSRMMRSGGVRFPQPSVSKVGGVSEFAAVLREAGERNVQCMPHSPYFGPAYWATLQLLAVTPGEPMLEHLIAHSPLSGRGTPLPQGGRVTIPVTPGIGFEPDWDVIERFAVH